MLVEFNIVADLYDSPNEEGISKLVKKGIVYKKMFDTTLTTCEHLINPRGRVLKGYTNIIVAGQQYRAKHTYEHVSGLLKPVIVKGFIKHAKGNYKN